MGSKVDKNIYKELEREELLHRVRNHFNLIISMFDITTASHTNNDFELMLSKIRNRIFAITHIYTKLEPSYGDEYTNTKNYFTELVNFIIDIYSHPNIEYDLQIEDVKMENEFIAKIGIVVNELISNCCEHAFNEDQRGKITIGFSTDNQNYYFSISDNGVGFEPGKIEGNGLNIVQGIVEYYDGHMEINTDVGTKVCFRFSKPQIISK